MPVISHQCAETAKYGALYTTVDVATEYPGRAGWSFFAKDRLQLEKLRTQYRQEASWCNPVEVQHPKLKNIVSDSYRERASVGSGSTADAVRVERDNK